MPASTPGNLVQYRYDPLDRQVNCIPFGGATLQRFYCKIRIATEIQGSLQHSILQHEDQLLAQRRCGNSKVEMILLATDQQRTVLHALDPNTPHAFAYTPYGHHPLQGLPGLPGFNGERPDSLTGHYHLGNGYRAFNPLLMRFISADNMSPFDKGGLNAYAYCEGKPILNRDPEGHFIRSVIVKPLLNIFTSRQSSSYIAKKLQTAHFVNLDGVAIKEPARSLGDKSAFRIVNLSKTDYLKNNNLNLKLDRLGVEFVGKNLNLRNKGSSAANGFGGADSPDTFNYFGDRANSLPMRKLLESIKRLDYAMAENRALMARTDSISNNGSRIRR